jgi:hypothetical protein
MAMSGAEVSAASADDPSTTQSENAMRMNSTLATQRVGLSVEVLEDRLALSTTTGALAQPPRSPGASLSVFRQPR